MICPLLRATVICSLLLLAGALQGRAAEIVLKGEYSCRRAVVRVGELGEIRGLDQQQTEALSLIPLLPAPAAGQTRVLLGSELRELLSLRGFDMAKLRIRGSDAIVLSGPLGGNAGQVDVDPAELKRARERAENAIRVHLMQKVRRASWQVSADLDAAAVPQLAGRLAKIAAEGGTEPWTGKQQFTLAIANRDGTIRIPVQAEVDLPTKIVVAKRTVKGGAMITAADVELLPVEPPRRDFEAIHSLDEVVGLEAAQLLASGHPVDRTRIRRPWLVKQRELITVFARTAGVQVCTRVRCLENGAQGDLVWVEAEKSRERYRARVIGYQEVEVFASGLSVQATPRRAPQRRSTARPSPKNIRLLKEMTESAKPF